MAKKGGGNDGVCGPIGERRDPDNECAQQASSSCGQTGSCNGSGACQLYAQGTSCGASVCQGSMVNGQLCNGMGNRARPGRPGLRALRLLGRRRARTPARTRTSASPGTSARTAFASRRARPGASCGGAVECGSGFCVDGVCCDKGCTDACEACSTAKKGQGADGVCGAIKNGTDPDSECAAQVPSTCGQNGQCNGSGACALYPAGSQCAPGSCSGTTQTGASQCDGTGTCLTGSMTMCVPGYGCDGTKCATSCTESAQCAPGYECDPIMQWCVPSMGGTGGMGGMGGHGGAGTGGSAGTGGAAGAGGAGGMGGAAGGGGAAGSGGTGEASGTGGGGQTTDEGGCGCRTASSSSPIGAMGALLVLASATALRRRKRSA